MNRYRILSKEIDGFTDCYVVQKRFLFFWYDFKFDCHCSNRMEHKSIEFKKIDNALAVLNKYKTCKYNGFTIHPYLYYNIDHYCVMRYVYIDGMRMLGDLDYVRFLIDMSSRNKRAKYHIVKEVVV